MTAKVLGLDILMCMCMPGILNCAKVFGLGLGSFVWHDLYVECDLASNHSQFVQVHSSVLGLEQVSTCAGIGTAKSSTEFSSEFK